jgi:hypothetical protein
MSVLVHLLLTVLILYCLVSYLVCGYVSFFPKNPELKAANFFAKLVFWVLSPLVLLDVLVEKVFGRSLL